MKDATPFFTLSEISGIWDGSSIRVSELGRRVDLRRRTSAGRRTGAV
ncbi:hypothetical protein SBD_6097 [Streptomyces bottropensis ATCC 25435]|uniref:Uncharacterized protein n=1 Tax=Streptomyces bottropensis ATCC 25435 TaxID=1054862 RepID=M3EA20_9ACTN|nr:hypothetical protein SBD_6097 [Streptomyces bottropensis ATCC 25435]